MSFNYFPDPIDTDFIDVEDYEYAALSLTKKRQLDAAYRILSVVFENQPQIIISSMRELLQQMEEEEEEEDDEE